MSENFDELKKELSPEARKRVEQRREEIRANLPLQELRQAREYTQQQLADSLGVDQSSVSKMERRTDMYLSTLRSYVEAMGGELEIRARFPEGHFAIDQLQNLDTADGEPSGNGRVERDDSTPEDRR